jgi:hypothetical protein
VILFSKKTKTPPIFKALTSEFKDRLRFGFVAVDTAPGLAEKYEITKFPSIIVLNSFDRISKEIIEPTE